MTEPLPAAGRAVAWVAFVGAIVVIAGFVWIWVNTDTTELWVHLFFLLIGGTIWLGLVWFVMGIIGLVAGVGAALTLPFWRRRK